MAEKAGAAKLRTSRQIVHGIPKFEFPDFPTVQRRPEFPEILAPRLAFALNGRGRLPARRVRPGARVGKVSLAREAVVDPFCTLR